MKLIPLTQGKFAEVDDEMFDYVKHWKWYASKGRHTYYAQRSCYIHGKKFMIKMHRFIMGETDPNIEIDHRNHNGLCNRGNNIRCSTEQQNKWNSRIRKNCSSKYRGVCFDKRCKRWMVEIYINGKKIFLGRFHDEIDAAKAYDVAAKKLFGEFANLNFPL